MKDTTIEHHIAMIGRPQQVCLLQLLSYSQHRFPWIYVSTSYFQFNEKQYNFKFYFHFIFNTKQLKFNLKLTNLCRFDEWQQESLPRALEVFSLLFDLIFLHASLFSAVCISCERFYAIYWSLKHRTLSTRADAVVMTFIWTLAILLAHFSSK